MEDNNSTSPNFEEFLKRNKKFDGLKAQRIGSGTFGSVYQCFNKTRKKDVVYKVMRSECRTQGLIENDMLRKLQSSKYVVMLYDTYRWKGNIVLEMELLVSIRDIFDVERPKFQSTTQLWKYFEQMLVGLNEIHKAGIIHRDISIDNIMYDPELDVIKYIDFGLSIGLEDDFILMNNPDAYKIAAPFFRAPELFGDKYIAYDVTIDEWALGCVFFWICTGLNIFEDIPMIVNKKRKRFSTVPKIKKYRTIPSIDQEKEDEEFKQKVLSYADKKDYYQQVWNIFEKNYRYALVDKQEFHKLSTIVRSMMESDIGMRWTVPQCLQYLQSKEFGNDARTLKNTILNCRQKICENVFEMMLKDLVAFHKTKRISSVENFKHILYELKTKYQDGCKQCSKKLPTAWKPKQNIDILSKEENNNFTILSTWTGFHKSSFYDNHIDHFVYMALDEFYMSLP